jgi:hypothetical protein
MLLCSEEHHLIPAAIVQMVRSLLLQIKDKQTFAMLFPLWDVHQLESSTLMKLLAISALDDNSQEIYKKRDALLLNQTNDTAFVDAFNAVMGTLSVVRAYMCVNNCETCMNGTCGTLETSEEYVNSELGNYTYDEIVARSEKYFNATLTFLNCIDYTTNGYGKVCFGAVYYDAESESDTPEVACNFESNGVQCNSCDMLLNDCNTADCTNIESAAMIDSCSGTGFVGPFTFLQYFFDNPAAVTSSTFTVGNCDIASNPTSPTGTAPTASAPVTSPPVASAPIAPTGTAPTASAPVTSPPVASAPIEPPTLESPISSPISAPTNATGPATPVPTSGSPGHYIGLKGVLLGNIFTAMFTMTI